MKLTKRQLAHVALDKMLDELERVNENTDMLDVKVHCIDVHDDGGERHVEMSAEIIETTEGWASVEEYRIDASTYFNGDLINEMSTDLDLD